MPVVGDRVGETRDSSGMVDAQRFLALTERLRGARERIEAAKISGGRRTTWHRLLVSVSETAQHDLDSADDKLTRLEAELDRHLP